MIFMGILLIANNVMQGHRAWYDSWSFNAQCLFDELVENWGGSPGYWAEVNMASIVVVYPIQILPLFESTSEFIDEWLWKRPVERINKAIRTSNELVSSSRSLSMKLRYQCQNSIYKMAFALYILVAALLGSRAASFVIDISWFVYGTWSVMSDRGFAAGLMDGSENSLTFGQIMPPLLLSSTILTFKVIYEGETLELESYYR